MSFYKEQIQQNPRICSRCLKKNKRNVNCAPENLRPSLRGVVVETKNEAVDDITERVYLDRKHAEHVCDCGTARNSTTLRDNHSLSAEQAAEFARNLSETLCELDVEHDSERLIKFVKEAKKRPVLAGKDDAVFERAIKVAQT